jgi:uncharacterized protein YqgV (UPF0045/DUF77 family)
MENREVYDLKFKNIDENLDDHEKRITKAEDKISDMDKSLQVSIVKTFAAIEKLQELPAVLKSTQETNQDIQKSLITLNNKVDNIDNKVGTLSDKVAKIDEDGKFNIREFIKTNWIPLGIGLAGLIAWAKSFFQ